MKKELVKETCENVVDEHEGKYLHIPKDFLWTCIAFAVMTYIIGISNIFLLQESYDTVLTSVHLNGLIALVLTIAIFGVFMIYINVNEGDDDEDEDE